MLPHKAWTILNVKAHFHENLTKRVLVLAVQILSYKLISQDTNFIKLNNAIFNLLCKLKLKARFLI